MRALPAEAAFKLGAFTENVPTLADPAQTYTLYLPAAYTTEKRWPLLLLFDPRQRGTLAAEIFRQAAEQHGWILISSNQTRSDGAEQPNIDALNALWPEARNRFSVDPKRIYAGGFSGGAILALLLATKVPLAGVIASGGRLADLKIQPPGFPHFGSAGLADFNYVEMRQLDDFFESLGAPHRFVAFPGPHHWMNTAIAAEAIEWMDLLAMRDGSLSRNEPNIATELRSQMQQAEGLVGQRHLNEAARRFREIVQTFNRLADVSAARSRLQQLQRDPQLERERQEERRWFRYETQTLQLLPRFLAAAQNGDEPLSAGRVRGDLRLPELLQRASRKGYEGEAAQRVLESFYTQFSFYLHQDAIAANDFARAVLYLSVADEIKPGRPEVLYNLSCALARRGEKRKAIESLRRALDAGFSDLKLLSSDPDLNSLRADPDFVALASRLSGARPPG